MPAWTRRLLLGGIAAGLSAPAHAAFTDRPIRMVVAYAAGGTGDLVGRMVAESLSQRLGTPVVVENQGGAGGAIAARAVSRAAPDGTTILLAGNAIFAILPHIANVGYDPVTGFTAIANISESQRLLAVRNTLPVTTLAELVEYGKRNPGKPGHRAWGSAAGEHSSQSCSNPSPVRLPWRSLICSAEPGLLGRMIKFAFCHTTLSS